MHLYNISGCLLRCFGRCQRAQRDNGEPREEEAEAADRQPHQAGEDDQQGLVYRGKDRNLKERRSPEYTIIQIYKNHIQS